MEQNRKICNRIIIKQDWDKARWIGYEEIPDFIAVGSWSSRNGDNLGNIAKKRTTVPCFRKIFQLTKGLPELSYLSVGWDNMNYT